MKNIRKKQPSIIEVHKKVAIYIRVSTHHQIDRDSLPFQRQELENYCRYLLNVTDFEIFEDAGYSAKNTDRPKFQEMMTRIRAGEFTHLLVWKLDRISRNLKDFTEMWEELKDYNVTFISKMEQFDTSTAMGEAMLKITLVFAELERKLTGERVFSIMLDRAQKGKWNGARVPLGYDWDNENKQVVINQAEATLVQQVFDKYEEFGSSAKVAIWLKENCKQTKRGGDWYPKGVNDILRNPIYTGTLRWNYRVGGRGTYKPDDEVITVENAVPTFIASEQYERVQLMLDDNFKGQRSNRFKKHIHVLSGLIKCGYCDRPYLCNLATRPHKYDYLPTYYRCAQSLQSRSCTNKAMPGLQIEPFVLGYIRAYMIASQKRKNIDRELLLAFNHEDIMYIDVSQTAHAEVLSAIAETAATTTTQVEDDKLAELKQQKHRTEQAISRLDDAYYFADDMDTMTKGEYLVKRSNFVQRLNQIDKQITSLASMTNKPTVNNIDLTRQFILYQGLFSAENLREALPFIDRELAQKCVQEVISEITVMDGRVTQIQLRNGQVHKFIYKSVIATP
ncbi:recombinase family protein [Sporomusa malonica]|uniref:Site-specific DNA recombinase n=1 Tax=Sporomusa malonica TaxID=112901 RepID=A0A1W2AVD6_9FIRM|nr:recombinase family protein [Sporomusa malonica]SMC64401.1 Site-specific DNA recombinase [Sporomusa malonica]